MLSRKMETHDCITVCVFYDFDSEVDLDPTRLILHVSLYTN
jgi:hypothetical protein